jgi:chromate transporter
MNDPLALFLIFLRAAALSVGGQGALPLLRQDLAGPGIVTEHQILEALAIGRIAPGPTGLYIVTLGYFAGGPLGAVIALAAALVPPVAMIAVASALRRQLLNAWAAGIVRGVALTAGGLLVATAIRLLAPDRAIVEVPFWQLALAVIGTALAIRGRTHPGLVMGAGALAGIIFGR